MNQLPKFKLDRLKQAPWLQLNESQQGKLYLALLIFVGSLAMGMVPFFNSAVFGTIETVAPVEAELWLPLAETDE